MSTQNPLRCWRETLTQAFRQNGVMALLATPLGCGAALSAQQPPIVDVTALRNVSTLNYKLRGSWLTYGKSETETRYSPLKQIDASNVKRLGLAGVRGGLYIPCWARQHEPTGSERIIDAIRSRNEKCVGTNRRVGQRTLA